MKHAKARKGSPLLAVLLSLLMIAVTAGSVCLILYDGTIPWFTESTTTTTTTTRPTTTAATTTTTVTTTTTTRAPLTTNAAGDMAFENTLFIGDFHTDGLSIYGNIIEADFFAETNLSSISVLSRSIEIDGLGPVKLEELLRQRQYNTVYIMLGINEISYAHSRIMEEYRLLLQTLQTIQPNITIVIQSTLHVRADKEQPNRGITNTNIDALNRELKTLANNTNVFYLDVNPVFDDETGAMDKQHSGDGIHLYTSRYAVWRDHLAANRF